MERTEWALRVLLQPTNFIAMQNMVLRTFQERSGWIYPFTEISLKRSKLADLHIASSDYVIWGTYWTSVISQPIEMETLLTKAAEAISRYGVVAVTNRDISRRLEAKPVGPVYTATILRPLIQQADMRCILDCMACCQDEDCRRHFGHGYEECMEECLKGCDIG